VAYVRKYRAGLFKRKWSVVLDGRDDKQYDQVFTDSVVFSADSSQLGYGAQEGSDKVLVVNGSEVERAAELAGPIFSPDGQTVACGVSRGSKKAVVVRGISGSFGASREYDVGDYNGSSLIGSAFGEGNCLRLLG